MWKVGLRYRKQGKLPGRPDFVFRRARVVVFCDSEFWHGYGWGTGARQSFKKNRNFWISKIERNIARDEEVNRQLKADGWTVLRFWENEILNDTDSCVSQVKTALRASLHQL